MSSAKDVVIPAKGKYPVDMQVAIAVPDGTYGRIAPWSGLAVQHMIQVEARVVDADY